MAGPTSLAAHYGRHPNVLAGILEALADSGHDIDALEPTALSGADEFHLGGRSATLAVLESVRDDPPRSVLDVGCGIGGPARTMAVELDASVLGVDLTPHFVEAAEELTSRVGLGDRASFAVGDALALDAADDTFDLVTLFHVGMNIADKRRLVAELARLTRPGGSVLVYDIMRIGHGALTLPLPWAATPEHQHLATAEDYLAAFDAVGLVTAEPVDHRPIVREALRRAADAPPPVDLSHLMGRDFAEMFANLQSAISDGIVAPIEIIARVPAR